MSVGNDGEVACLSVNGKNCWVLISRRVVILSDSGGEAKPKHGLLTNKPRRLACFGNSSENRVGAMVFLFGDSEEYVAVIFGKNETLESVGD